MPPKHLSERGNTIFADYEGSSVHRFKFQVASWQHMDVAVMDKFPTYVKTNPVCLDDK